MEIFLLSQNVRTLFSANHTADEHYTQAQRYLAYVSKRHMTAGGIEVEVVDLAATTCLV